MIEHTDEYFRLEDKVYYECPLQFRALARSYIEEGRFDFPDGSPSEVVTLVDAFVQVIQNDLSSLVTNHHESTYLTCYQLVKWFQLYVPKAIWGSPAQVGSWISYVTARRRRDQNELVKRIISNVSET